MGVSQGFFIAQKKQDGSPGRPIGTGDFEKDGNGPLLLFEDLEEATRVRAELVKSTGPLSIFQVNLVMAGEVIL